MLRGRRYECAALDRVLEAVRAGESRALVVRGMPGVGKTALLAYVAERASGCRVLQVAGVQSEMEMAFAGLHQLTGPLLDGLERLPAPHEQLTAIGVEAFAERASRELRALGVATRKRRAKTPDRLTPQEAQIARLARDGLSNPEIGARLFISPRTAQYHLSKVFAKLDIHSRTQLDRALATDPTSPAQSTPIGTP